MRDVIWRGREGGGVGCRYSNNGCGGLLVGCPMACSRVETAIEDSNLEVQERLYRSRG